MVVRIQVTGLNQVSCPILSDVYTPMAGTIREYLSYRTPMGVFCQRSTTRDAARDKGNSYESPELPTAYPRGRARKLPQNLDEIQEEPSSPGVAAAASTQMHTTCKS
jgi:hypothetical protein